jgi:hypothetical protein
MQRRPLDFRTYDEVIAEIDRLNERGYEQIGKWTLGQMCAHLNYYYRGSLEGYKAKLPSVIRYFIGRPLLKKVLKNRSFKPGGQTIPKSVPPDQVDDQAAIAEAKELLIRLRDTTAPPHPSPIFGQLTPEQCRDLHLIHTAHHLSFLIPR